MAYEYFNGQNEPGLYLVPPDRNRVNTPYTCDIIFVHGINGGPRSTWQHSSKAIWFRDWLPFHIDDKDEGTNARIFTFGYNAKFAFGGSRSGINDHANSLLERVHGARRHEGSHHKIIWICHSLGGIIVKAALIEAVKNDRYMSLVESTVGIIFLGTPHRGSDSAVTLASGAASIVRNITIGIIDPPRQLIENLKTDSEILLDIHREFSRTHDIYKNTMRIACFYENLKVVNQVIVKKHSAVTDIYGETTMELNANHMDLVRFANCNDQNYMAIRLRISDMMKLTRYRAPNFTKNPFRKPPAPPLPPQDQYQPYNGQNPFSNRQNNRPPYPTYAPSDSRGPPPPPPPPAKRPVPPPWNSPAPSNSSNSTYTNSSSGFDNSSTYSGSTAPSSPYTGSTQTGRTSNWQTANSTYSRDTNASQSSLHPPVNEHSHLRSPSMERLRNPYSGAGVGKEDLRPPAPPSPAQPSTQTPKPQPSTDYFKASEMPTPRVAPSSPAAPPTPAAPENSTVPDDEGHHLCDGCMGAIRGGDLRFNCTTCDDYDLCGSCFNAKKVSKTHALSHGMRRILSTTYLEPEDLIPANANKIQSPGRSLPNWTIDEADPNKPERWLHIREGPKHARYLAVNVKPALYDVVFYLKVRVSRIVGAETMAQLKKSFLFKIKACAGTPVNKSDFLNKEIPETDKMGETLFQSGLFKVCDINVPSNAVAGEPFIWTVTIPAVELKAIAGQAKTSVALMLYWTEVQEFQALENSVSDMSLTHVRLEERPIESKPAASSASASDHILAAFSQAIVDSYVDAFMDGFVQEARRQEEAARRKQQEDAETLLILAALEQKRQEEARRKKEQEEAEALIILAALQAEQERQERERQARLAEQLAYTIFFGSR